MATGAGTGGRRWRTLARRNLEEIAFDSANPKAALAELPRGAGGFRAVRGGGARGALHRAHAKPARKAGTAAAAFGQASAAPATGGPCAAHRVASDRLGVRVSARPVRHAPKPVRDEVPGSDALECACICSFPGRQSLSARHRHPPAQSARGRLGLRAVCFARRGGALCGRGAQAVSAAPLHLRFESRSKLSRLRLLRDEDVPGAVLQGLHRRALRRGGRGRGEISSLRAARAGW